MEITEEGLGRESEGWRSRLAADLAAHDAEQRRVWGDTDELLRARYTAGMCTEEEKARVEQAMRDFPAVGESIETVRDLMAKWEIAAPAESPDILPIGDAIVPLPLYRATVRALPYGILDQDSEKERMLLTSLKANVPTLLAAIGFFVNRAKVALAPPDRQQLRAAGAAWLADREGDLKERLRQDPAIWALISSAEARISDALGTARQIVELILPVCGDIPATHVAVLLVRQKLGD